MTVYDGLMSSGTVPVAQAICIKPESFLRSTGLKDNGFACQNEGITFFCGVQGRTLVWFVDEILNDTDISTMSFTSIPPSAHLGFSFAKNKTIGNTTFLFSGVLIEAVNISNTTYRISTMSVLLPNVKASTSFMVGCTNDSGIYENAIITVNITTGTSGYKEFEQTLL